MLNPDYNPENEYIPRKTRKEWEAVGLIGKLYLRDDGSAAPGDFVTAKTDGIATVSDTKTGIRVLARVNENVIKVLLK